MTQTTIKPQPQQTSTQAGTLLINQVSSIVESCPWVDFRKNKEKSIKKMKEKKYPYLYRE